MNLSLRTAGKTKCTDSGLDILSTLSQLMESDSMQVRTYVNGTLYSVLTRAPLKARAEEIGLPDSLRALIEHSDETFARQINYILEQVRHAQPPPTAARACVVAPAPPTAARACVRAWWHPRRRRPAPRG